MNDSRSLQTPGTLGIWWPRYGWCVVGSVGLHLVLLAVVACVTHRSDLRNPDLELHRGFAGIRLEWRPAPSICDASACSPSRTRSAAVVSTRPPATPTPTRPTALPAQRLPASMAKAGHQGASASASAATTSVARASYCPAPPYPTAARRAGREGTVRLRLTIAENGRVTAARILESSGRRDFDEAARTTILRQWKYHPAQQTGTAVGSIEVVRVEFKLETS